MRRELTLLGGFNLTTAGLLTLQHRGLCGLTHSTTRTFMSSSVFYVLPCFDDSSTMFPRK